MFSRKGQSHRLGIALCCLFAVFSADLRANRPVKVGADVLLEKRLNLLMGKRIGVITNHTGVLSDGQHIVDALLERHIEVAALFGPEHGIRGETPDGVSIQGGRDTRTGLPVYSLYGADRKPTADMLHDIDVLVFDIQTVDARFYTFLSTMMLAMEAAAEYGVDFMVLDRPNPTRGLLVEGPVREDTLRSFISLPPIPIRTGMTVGELAEMINEEGWLAGGAKARLTVIPMEGWRRSLWYDETDVEWVRPSPNMMTLRTAIVYDGSALIEGVANVSEGRGTERPFEYIGSPWVDGEALADELNAHRLPGVKFEQKGFLVERVEGRTPAVKFEGEQCDGVFINVVDRDAFRPVPMGVALLHALKKLYGGRIEWRKASLDRLAGTSRLRELLDDGAPVGELLGVMSEGLERFMELRSNYLLYE
ncbi:MAG TPA: DUF1343 domain-containing protein [Bacteroidota bacterium]